MKIYFILVEPAVPENIGASARAIKTLGFKYMRLVRPCDYLSTEARMLAHASGEILENAEVFGDLKEALKNIDLSIATTAKKRGARVDYIGNAELTGLIRSKGEAVETIGIVFGREESGLSNDEIRMCDLVSYIPLKQSYPSLNLSQAVMLYAYSLAELVLTHRQGKDPADRRKGSPAPVSAPLPFRTLMERSGELLRKLEVDRSPALYNRIMERIALLGEEDVHLLLSVFSRFK
jgi:tRNA/rRNA methyltransferase